MEVIRRSSGGEAVAANGGDSSMFDITLEQLSELMEVKGQDLMEKLNSSKYNGVKGVLEKLKVDENKGLDSNNKKDLEQRRTAYGRNVIPPTPMMSFQRFCSEALFDNKLLIILLICAIVLIGLSFYKPPVEGGSEGKAKRDCRIIEFLLNHFFERFDVRIVEKLPRWQFFYNKISHVPTSYRITHINKCLHLRKKRK